MYRVTGFIKSHRYWTGGVVTLLALACFFIFRDAKEAVAESITVAKSRIAEEVSVTGRVVPAQEVNLAIQAGGKVRNVNVRTGQKVTVGQTLLTVESADLEIRLARQRAALERAKLGLASQEPNTGDAESNLRIAYEEAFNSVSEIFLDMPAMVMELEDILYNPSHSMYIADNNRVWSVSGDTGTEYKNTIGLKFDALKVQYEKNLVNFRAINRDSAHVKIEWIIDETYETTRSLADTIKSVTDLIGYLKERQALPLPEQISIDQSTLHSYTQEVNAHLLNIFRTRAAIKDSRDDIITESGSTETTRIEVRQAELDIQDTLLQISNRKITSPINGVVTEVSIGAGETLSAGTSVISIISSSEYEIEANIPEADISKVSVGAEVEVTLDAYGSDAVFEARVVSVNPAETLVDGVATYKAIFQFASTNERIKSGMTANLVIVGKSVEDVLAVPQRSVIVRGGKKYLRVIENDVVVEKEVTTGLKGSDGNVEIVSGIDEGDKVVVFSQ